MIVVGPNKKVLLAFNAKLEGNSFTHQESYLEEAGNPANY